MGINKLRKGLYAAAKALGDANAIKKGKPGKRVKKRVAGKLAGKLLKKI